MFAVYNDIMGSIEIMLLILIALGVVVACYVWSVGHFFWTLVCALYIYLVSVDLFVEFYNTLANEL